MNRSRTIVVLLLVSLALVGIVTAADIVLNFTVSDANGKASEQVKDYAQAHGWTAKIDDPNSNDPAVVIDNPFTPRQWTEKVLKDNFKETVKAWRVAKKAQKASADEIIAVEAEIVFK